MRTLIPIGLATALALMLAGPAAAQTITEFGAAAAGGTAGGAAGKRVSDGLTNVFGKVDQQTKAAAKQDLEKQEKTPSTPAASSISASPAPGPAASSPAPSAGHAPKAAPAAKISSARTARRPPVRHEEIQREEPVSVPDPPALRSHSAAVAKAPAPEPPPPPAAAPAPPPPPPAPEITVDALKSIAPGEERDQVLKLGIPSTRITMFGDDGHLLEIYSYVTKNALLGIVRLSDGEVSKVELR